jgi:hypothetical protein
VPHPKHLLLFLSKYDSHIKHFTCFSQSIQKLYYSLIVVSQYWQFGTSIYSYFSLSILVYPYIELILLKINANIDEEPMILLKMTCPSTGHIHILRVPPEMTSAEAAITWVNHGIHPDEFGVQT